MSPIEFLERWKSGGPWVLTAIGVDRKSVETKTFDHITVESMEEWINRNNGQRNVYFHVNSTTGPLTSKANRENIKSVDWLHVDIDPRAGEDLEFEQQRALSLLTDRLPSGVPEPTCIVFSGGGYQGFWRLDKSIIIDGDLKKAEDAKRYNQQLELLFHADHCHNIDRIMRLPGTLNIPDKKKKRSGRVEVLSSVHSFNDTSFPLSQFIKAPEIQSPLISNFGSSEEINVNDDIERIQDLADLDEWSVPDRIKIIIAQGTHPEEEKDNKKDTSRSGWLFDVVTGLARCRVPDEIIYSIITDSGWPISESVVELKQNAHKYALRQIKRAKEYAIDPRLTELNEKHAVISNIGGKCRIIEEVDDEILGRSKLTVQTFQDFRDRYSNIPVVVGVDKDGKDIKKPMGKWWVDHEMRTQYSTVVFAPEREIKGAYNMWKGFACSAEAGACDLFLNHVADNVCGGSSELYKYVLGWMARMVQHPSQPGEVALVLRGARGTGKSFFAVQLGALLGRHFLQVSNSVHLTGHFNSHLRDLVLLFADEAFFAGDRRHTSVLKTLITEPTLTIERKGIDVEQSANCIHLIMASNDQHVIPAGGHERRFCVLDVGAGRMQDTGYFKAIYDQMENGGREALLHFLLNYDLEGFRVANVPVTKALIEQKLLSMTPEDEWWYTKLSEGQITEKDGGWPSEIMKTDVLDDFIEHTKRFNSSRRGTETALGRYLTRMCPAMSKFQKSVIAEEFVHGKERLTQKRKYFYKMPTLEECRATWDQLNGGQEWPEIFIEDGRNYEEHPF